MRKIKIINVDFDVHSADKISQSFDEKVNH